MCVCVCVFVHVCVCVPTVYILSFSLPSWNSYPKTLVGKRMTYFTNVTQAE